MVKLTEKLVLGRARADDLGAVKNLNCWGSDLTDVSILRRMHNLEVINVSANNIQTLQHFSHCSNLREVYLRKNNVQDLNQILHLKDLRQLRLLWLSDNPCCASAEDTKYRLAILRALPNLLKLDNIAVTPEEVEKAREGGDELENPEELTTEANCSAQQIPVNSLLEESSETESNYNHHPDKSVIPESNDRLHLKRTPSENDDQGNSDTFPRNKQSMEAETELALRPLSKQPISKHIGDAALQHTKTQRTRTEKSRRHSPPNNILMASLALVRELDEDGLRTLQGAVQDRLQSSFESREYTTFQDEPQSLNRSASSNGTAYSQNSSGDRSLVERT